MIPKFGKAGLAALALYMTFGPSIAQADACGEALLAQGERAHGQGNHRLVLESYTQALETCNLSNEMAAHIYARRGIINFVNSNMAEAAADYSASLELAAERSTLILMKRASAYLATNDNQLAVADLDEALTLEPDKGALYLMRMNANQRLGNEDAVQDDFQTIEAAGDMTTQWAAYKLLGIDPEALTQ